METFEGQQEEFLSINKVFARAFINYLNQAVAVEMNEVLPFFAHELIRFKRLNQAHMSVLSSLSLLVTDQAEAFGEYDRMRKIVSEKSPGSAGEHLLTVGRENMEKMLAQASLARGN